MSNDALLSPDSKPESLFTGYLRHASGATKEIEIIALDGKMLLIWWPMAGLHEVNTRTGRLKGGKRYARWSMEPSEVSRCVRALQGHAKRLHARIELPGEGIDHDD